MVSIYINIKDTIAPIKIKLLKENSKSNNISYLVTNINCPYFLKIAYKRPNDKFIFLDLEKTNLITNSNNEILYQVMYELTNGNQISLNKAKELDTVI